jgi:Protein of unknown function DUF58
MRRRGTGVFPLVPRRRFAGVLFGYRRSRRRGHGDEVAGSRPYRPGDPISWIDWKASARLTAARGYDDFVVREYLAEEAPNVVIVCDRRPAMALYRPPLPWLDKGKALAVCAETIAASALAARSEFGYLDLASAPAPPFWLPPATGPRPGDVERRNRECGFDAPVGGLQRALDVLLGHAGQIQLGSFVFIVSDHLAPVRNATYARLKSVNWDVVPVIIQDPVWEQSFPPVGGVVLPLADPTTGAVALTRLSEREASQRASANEERLQSLLLRFRRLGFDPVLIPSSQPDEILQRFHGWARRRELLRGRRA